MIFAIRFALLFIFCRLAYSAERRWMPKEIPLCYKNDTSVDKCLLAAIQKSLPHLAKGYSKINLLPIDPLLTIQSRIEQHYGPVTFVFQLRDYNTYNLAKTKLLKVKSNIDKYKLDVEGVNKNITIQGKYFVKGQIFVLPIEGSGDLTVRLENVRANLKLRGDKLSRNGLPHMKLRRFDVDFQPQRIHFHLTNLFGGNKQLGDYANQFLNEHNQAIYTEVKAPVEESVGAVFKELSRRFYDKVPYDQIYL